MGLRQYLQTIDQQWLKKVDLELTADSRGSLTFHLRPKRVASVITHRTDDLYDLFPVHDIDLSGQIDS